MTWKAGLRVRVVRRSLRMTQSQGVGATLKPRTALLEAPSESQKLSVSLSPVFREDWDWDSRFLRPLLTRGGEKSFFYVASIAVR